MAPRLLRLPAVLEKTGDSQTVWYGKVKDKIAPQPIPTGPRTVAWIESEIDDYIERLIAARHDRPRLPGGPGRRTVADSVVAA